MLCDETQTGLGACAKDANAAGTYTREKGFLSYYEVISNFILRNIIVSSYVSWKTLF